MASGSCRQSKKEQQNEKKLDAYRRLVFMCRATVHGPGDGTKLPWILRTARPVPRHLCTDNPYQATSLSLELAAHQRSLRSPTWLGEHALCRAAAKHPPAQPDTN